MNYWNGKQCFFKIHYCSGVLLQQFTITTLTKYLNLEALWVTRWSKMIAIHSEKWIQPTEKCWLYTWGGRRYKVNIEDVTSSCGQELIRAKLSDLSWWELVSLCMRKRAVTILLLVQLPWNKSSYTDSSVLWNLDSRKHTKLCVITRIITRLPLELVFQLSFSVFF